MKIIKANSNIVEEILNLIQACKKSLIEDSIYQWDDLYPNSNIVQRDQANGTLYIAIIADTLIGTISLSSEQEPEYAQVKWQFSEPSLVIHRVCVSPSHQSHGIGTSLINFAENHAQNKGFCSIRLDVYSGNYSAVSLYEHLGYSRVGQVFFPRRSLPFHCMEKQILQKS